MSCIKRIPVAEICTEKQSECCGDVCLYDENVSACKYGVDIGTINKYLLILNGSKLPRIEKVVGAHDTNEAIEMGKRQHPNYPEIKVYDWIY